VGCKSYGAFDANALEIESLALANEGMGTKLDLPRRPNYKGGESIVIKVSVRSIKS
jgi:hypothetical protein